MERFGFEASATEFYLHNIVKLLHGRSLPLGVL